MSPEISFLPSSSSLDGETYAEESPPFLQDMSARERKLRICEILLSYENLVMMENALNL